MSFLPPSRDSKPRRQACRELAARRPLPAFFLSAFANPASVAVYFIGDLNAAMYANDVTKLGEWFGRYGPGLVLYAAQWLGRDAAEDVVQEVFLRLWRRESVGTIASERNWLYQAVRNAAIDRMRSTLRRSRREQHVAAGRPAWFQSRPTDSLEGQEVQAALEHLPREQREIIVLRIWAGFTLAEAAALTGEPVSTLNSRYRAGLAELRRRLETPCRSPST